MEIKNENSRLHCRTCLVNITTDQQESVYLANCSNGLQNWVHNCLNPYDRTADVDIENDSHFPQQLCHECYETLRVASEFRSKVQKAERLLTDSLPIVSEEYGELAACCICLRQYPQAVRSLTCQLRDMPHLKEWLEWSGAQIMNEEWGMANVMCRFCYGKLRDGYEWHLAAKETAEYLRNKTASEHAWDNNSQIDDITYQPFIDQFQMPATISVKEEIFDVYPHEDAEYPEYEFIPESGIPTDAVNDLDSSLLCLDVPYNVKRDFHCDSCATNFSNSILYKNHICPINTSINSDFLDKHIYGQDSDLITTGAVIHNNSRKKVCEQCQKRFNKSFLLDAHILQVHQGKKKPFVCKYCTHAYLTHTHLKRHIKNSHKQEWMHAFQDNSSNMHFWM